MAAVTPPVLVTIIGDGAHSIDIQATVPAHNIRRVIPHHNEYTPINDDYVVIAVNDPQTRARIQHEIRLDDRWHGTWIHPEITVGPACDAGAGTHINYAVSLTRTTIGRNCTISPGVTICGGVLIGDRTLIGAGATICDRVTIGHDVTIGAGAVVLPETVICDGETWVGVPAREITP